MWSSTSSSRGISSSSSSSKSSSSSSSSRSPFSPSNHHLNPRLKTMEEVWKDINLSSLQEHTTTYSRDHDHHQTANFGGMILQDFLARPFATDPQPPPAASPVPSTTMLNLNSVPELHFFSQNSILRPPTPISQVPFEGLASSAANGRKRVPETENNSAGDRRNKRMIKNRESAARSRARKQESS
ncbi:PREDICTED: bZIP transcription factor 27-like [Nicotiana attenuata]|uniref:Bzip transcription factor 27 n=1 Tax=Nicotiana attenuata TaxID=49451 RepID=A0A314KZQ5_NICAT|nr:PREDICTED: bZIP transcription factor 27-like [Nicotiana attenuata]OIT34702.1 bzip transcription factor 27 [Nicotiana attenuata]